MTFALREYDSRDFNRLYQIDQSCFSPGIAYSRRELAYYMSLRGAFTVVAETGTSLPEIAGFIVGQKHPRGLGHVITIDTLAKFRRAGLGSLLMNAAERRFKKAGCHAIVLETAVDNEAAIAFYKRLDYFILKTIPRYYHNKIDAFMMAKRIAEIAPERATKAKT